MAASARSQLRTLVCFALIALSLSILVCPALGAGQGREKRPRTDPSESPEPTAGPSGATPDPTPTPSALPSAPPLPASTVTPFPDCTPTPLPDAAVSAIFQRVAQMEDRTDRIETAVGVLGSRFDEVATAVRQLAGHGPSPLPVPSPTATPALVNLTNGGEGSSTGNSARERTASAQSIAFDRERRRLETDISRFTNPMLKEWGFDLFDDLKLLESGDITSLTQALKDQLKKVHRCNQLGFERALRLSNVNAATNDTAERQLLLTEQLIMNQLANRPPTFSTSSGRPFFPAPRTGMGSNIPNRPRACFHCHDPSHMRNVCPAYRAARAACPPGVTPTPLPTPNA